MKFDLEDRLVDFAGSIVLLCKDLPNDWTGLYYGKQLLRSDGSILPSETIIGAPKAMKST